MYRGTIKRMYICTGIESDYTVSFSSDDPFTSVPLAMERYVSYSGTYYLYKHCHEQGVIVYVDENDSVHSPSVSFTMSESSLLSDGYDCITATQSEGNDCEKVFGDLIKERGLPLYATWRGASFMLILNV